MVEVLDRLQAGETAGSFGTGAFTGETTIITDVRTDSCWRPFLEVAERFDIRACWSFPVERDGRVAAAFAIFHTQPCSPDSSQRRLLTRASHIASVAIHRSQTVAAIERFQTILDQAGEAIYVIDPVTARFLDANRSAGRDLGYSREELLELVVSEIQCAGPQNSREHWIARVEGLKALNRPLLRQGVHVRKDGSEFPVEVATSYHLIQGRGYILAVVRDITLRKAAEEQLEAQHQILGQLASGTSLQLVLETLVHFIERQFPGMLASVLILDGERLRQGAAPSLPEEYNQLIEGVKIGPAVGSCGTAAYQKKRVIVEDILTDPLWKDFREHTQRFGLRSCWSQPVLSKAGDVLGTLALYYHEKRAPTEQELSLVDWSANAAGIAIERMHAERALRESEEEYRVITESAGEAILTVDVDGVIIFANPTTERIFGYPTNELIGQPATMLIPDSLRERHVFAFRQLVQSGESASRAPVEIEGLHQNGDVVNMELSFGRHIRNGKQFFAGILRDVGERKRAERELKKREAELAHVGRLSMLGGAIAHIAHEINQPLFAISNFAKAAAIEMGKNTASPEELRSRFQRIDGLATTAGDILKRIRGFLSRSDADYCLVPVRELIEESVQIIEFEAKRMYIKVESASPDSAVSIWADRVQVQQVIVNLLKNALDELADVPFDERTVQISCCVRDEMVEIAVRDSGCGLEQTIPESVFEAFHSTKSEGMGIGLAISKNIVESHGGEIWITENDGPGVTFHIGFPVPDQFAKSSD